MHHAHSLWNKAYTVLQYSSYLIHLHARSETFYCPLCLFRFNDQCFCNKGINEHFKAEQKVKENG